MAAPEERELTAEQTEKLLQFQVPRPGGRGEGSVPAGGSGGGGASARSRPGWARLAGVGALPACSGPGGTGLTESRGRPRLERDRWWEARGESPVVLVLAGARALPVGASEAPL